jgi:gas vesicle protein
MGWHEILLVLIGANIGFVKTSVMNKIFYALLAGVVVGVLLAPDKGSETIKKLRSRINDYKNDAEDEADEFVSKGKAAFAKGRTKLNETFD